MKLVLWFFLFLMSNVVCAQQGRHELPIDTISIGGKEQDIKMTRLEGYEELLSDLTEVRDSIASNAGTKDDSVSGHSTETASPDNAPSNYLSRLNDLIREMRREDNDENLMKQGYTLLDEIRKKRS